MATFVTKKHVKTYSRQKRRSPLEDNVPAKRQRVERAIDKFGIESDATSTIPSQTSSPRPNVTAATSSSPRFAPAIFSDDEPFPSSPPSSPPRQSSPLPKQKRRPIFSLYKRKSQARTSADKTPLSEQNNNAQHLPAPAPAPREKRLVQMQLDLASEHRKTCKTCGMEYIPSNPEDAVLHRKFHAMNFGGVDFTKSTLDRLRKNQIWSGGDNSFIAVVGRKDALALRTRASDVLKVVNTELAAVHVKDEDLWSRTGSTAFTEVQKKEAKSPNVALIAPTKQGSLLVDRFKMYLYLQGNKCVGACLAERIWEAYTVIDGSDACQPRAALQSSSISISITSHPTIMGISRIWTSSQYRKKRIATKLLDNARANFLYGLIVEKKDVAFSQPTESGGNLARKWYGRQAGWKVYID